MHRFFVEKILPPSALLSPRESRHAARVLRLAAGERVTLFDSRETWIGEVESLEGRVRVRLIERLPEPSIPAVTVAAALPKGGRLDWMVEKLAELGVREIMPVRFARSVVVMSDSRRRRLERIAVAAAKQSGAPVLSIGPERGVEEIPADALLVTPGATEPLPRGGGTVVVGPEGGLTAAEEARFARRHTLGSTILRIETAAVVAAARLLG